MADVLSQMPEQRRKVEEEKVLKQKKHKEQARIYRKRIKLEV
jgi:hypothetical protein